MLLKFFSSKLHTHKSTLQSDFNEIEQLEEEQVATLCTVSAQVERYICNFADWFWEADNFSDDTKCLFVVVCSRFRLSEKCNPCHHLSVGVSSQFLCCCYLTLFRMKAMIREK